MALFGGKPEAKGKGKCGKACPVLARTAPAQPPKLPKGTPFSQPLCPACGVVWVPDLFEMEDEKVDKLPVTRAHLDAAVQRSRPSIRVADLRHYEEFTAASGERT